MRRDHRVPGSRDARGAAAAGTQGPHIYRRGPVWWAYLPPRRRVSLRTSDRREAEQLFAERLAEVRRELAGGRLRNRAVESPLALIALKWARAPHGWTRRNQATAEIRSLAFVKSMEALGVRLVSQITPARLDAWRLARMNVVARATINRDEAVARRMIRWARGQGLCLIDPFAGRALLREPRRSAPPLIPSPAEVRQVIDAMSAAGETGAALAIASQLACGARLDELRHLQLQHVDDAGVQIAPEKGSANDAWTSKGYRERRVPLAPVAVATVRRFIRWRSGTGKQGKAIGLSDTWLAEKIDEACATAGVSKFRSHDLRRTFATENVRRGAPLTVVRAWLGHRDVQTTERYLGRYRSDEAQVAATSPALAVRVPLAAVKRRR